MSRIKNHSETQSHTPVAEHYTPFNNVSTVLKSQQGFSLVELLMVVGLSAILVYGIGSLMNISASQSESLREKIRFEAESYELSFNLKHIVSMAVGVEIVDADLNAQNSLAAAAPGPLSGPNIGFIRTYDFAGNYTIGDAANIDTIGYFLRETLTSAYVGAAPGAKDRFRPTAIYFQKPTERTFGVLYIDLGGPQTAATVTMSPDASDLRYEGLVDLKILDMEAETSNFDAANPDTPPVDHRRLSSVTFKVTHREYFATPNDATAYRWCPSTFMDQPECATKLQYRDMEQVVRVVLRNNVLSLSNSQINKFEPTAFTVVGQSPSLPRMMPMEKRPFEFVYFLKAAYPLGQLKR